MSWNFDQNFVQVVLNLEVNNNICTRQKGTYCYLHPYAKNLVKKEYCAQ